MVASRAESVTTVDCHYFEPEHAAAYLLVEEGRAAFIDNNTVHAVPYLMQALQARGLRPEDVAYLIITHLHMDHAGATSTLVRLCPNATVLTHPRGVRHLVDPARLIAGVKGVYGEAEFDRLYAPVYAIDPQRIRTVEDNETMQFGARTLTFMHTRGHANHHICIHDSASNSVFTGDTFGGEYKASRSQKRPFILYSSAPTDFDPEEARASIRRIVDTGAERVYLAHYGELTDIPAAVTVLSEWLDSIDTILNEAIQCGYTEDALVEFCNTRVQAAADALANTCGAVIEEREWCPIRSFLHIDAQGVAYLAEKRRG